MFANELRAIPVPQIPAVIQTDIKKGLTRLAGERQHTMREKDIEAFRSMWFKQDKERRGTRTVENALRCFLTSEGFEVETQYAYPSRGPKQPDGFTIRW